MSSWPLAGVVGERERANRGVPRCVTLFGDLSRSKGPGSGVACPSGSLFSCVVCCRGSAVLSGAFLLEEGFVHEGVVTTNHFERLLLGTFHDEAADDHFF